MSRPWPGRSAPAGGFGVLPYNTSKSDWAGGGVARARGRRAHLRRDQIMKPFQIIYKTSHPFFHVIEFTSTSPNFSLDLPYEAVELHM